MQSNPEKNDNLKYTPKTYYPKGYKIILFCIFTHSGN